MKIQSLELIAMSKDGASVIEKNKSDSILGLLLLAFASS